jgi:hypothetical protein
MNPIPCPGYSVEGDQYLPDRRLQEAFANEAARQAGDLVIRAISKLKSVSRATGERKFESVIGDLEGVKQKITDAAATQAEPAPGDAVLFPDRTEVIDSSGDDGIRLSEGELVDRSRLVPVGPHRWKFTEARS